MDYTPKKKIDRNYLWRYLDVGLTRKKIFKLAYMNTFWKLNEIMFKQLKKGIESKIAE